ncbi:MAG TPA: glycosyltransferase family 39 protein [Chloroflexia bacterium]|nr:glycosyltransferase family 39 protein [Chloroflexia bacterium]
MRNRAAAGQARLVPALLAGVLLLSLVLRLVGIDWGIPEYDSALMPHTPYRHSYHIDEDNYLWGLMQMKPSEGNFDILDYHWGALQHYLVYGALLGGSAIGVVPAPWEAAFSRGDVQALPRIYVVGRLVSVSLGVACTAVVIALAAALGGWTAGLAGGLAYAVAPFAVVEAHYLGNDVTMSMLAASSVLCGVLGVLRGNTRLLVASGLLLGLATADKYSGAFAAPSLLAAQWALYRTTLPMNSREALIHAIAPWAAVAAGFAFAQPYALIRPNSLIDGLRMAAEGNAVSLSGGASLLEPLKMLGWQLYNLAGVGLTWPLGLMALAGLLILLRQAAGLLRAANKQARTESSVDMSARTRRYAAAVVLCAVGGVMVGLMLNRVYMLRYSQPLVPVAAVAAGLAWASISRGIVRTAAGGAVILVAAWITLGQLALMTGPHPANSVLGWFKSNLKPGQQLARLWPEYPVLDDSRYRLIRLDPWRPELPAGARPDYIMLDDMQLGPADPKLIEMVAHDYREVARFGARPHVGPFTWDEGTTPHDWKYSHPTFIIYALK